MYDFDKGWKEKKFSDSKPRHFLGKWPWQKPSSLVFWYFHVFLNLTYGTCSHIFFVLLIIIITRLFLLLIVFVDPFFYFIFNLTLLWTPRMAQSTYVTL